jgi:hypothetical protein
VETLLALVRMFIMEMVEFSLIGQTFNFSRGVIMRFILLLAVFLLPSLALSYPTSKELHNHPIFPDEVPVVEYLKESSKLPKGGAEQVVRTIRSFEDPLLLIAIMMTETEGDVNARTDDRHGLMGISESYLKDESFRSDLSTCGVSSVDDFYDMGKSFCAARKIFEHFYTKNDSDFEFACAQYGGSFKKGGYVKELSETYDVLLYLVRHEAVRPAFGNIY